MLPVTPTASLGAYTCSQIQFSLTFESVRQRKPSKGLPAASWVKIPADQPPFGNPWPRWLILTPSSQIACSPFEAVTGLLSLTICSTPLPCPALACTWRPLSTRFPPHFPPAHRCLPTPPLYRSTPPVAGACSTAAG